MTAAPPAVRTRIRRMLGGIAVALCALTTRGEAQEAADIAFLRAMIPHHAQALVMVELVEARTTSRDIRLLAERIAVSQRDEIAQMQALLRRVAGDSSSVAAPGNAAPAGADAREGHGAHDRHAMPGMLSAAELDTLRAATGDAFDRRFLASMIRHHEGALTMVAELFASAGGAQRSEIFTLASEVESDQQMEIARMRRLLARRP